MRRMLMVLGAALYIGGAGLEPLGGAAVVRAQIAVPTAGAVLRPIRVRPTRPPRPSRVRPVRGVPTPTRTPTGTPMLAPTATPKPPPATDCEHACSYSVSQMRMLWYGSLSFTAVIKTGGCEPLDPQLGDTGTVQLTKFVTGARQDLGYEHHASFVLGANGGGTTSLNGAVQFSSIAGSYAFSYSAPVSAVANIRAGQNFPVAFNMCVTVGSHAVRMHLVCQGKNQGMLCHEG